MLAKRSEPKLFSIVTIIKYGFKIIGLAPFAQQSKTSHKISRNIRIPRAFYFSKIGLAYNLLIIILLQIMVALAFPALSRMSYANSSFITVAIDVVQGIISCFTTYVIIISWAFGQENAASVMNRLLEIDRLLSGLEKQPSSSKRVLIFFSLHVIFNICLWTTFSATETLLLSDAILAWCFFGPPCFVIYWFIIEYFIVVRLVAWELKRVNRNLLELKGFPNYLFSMPFFNDYLAVSSLSRQSQLARLQLLHTIRTTLFEVFQDIADFFSFPILLSIGCLFFMLVNTVYYLASPLLVSNSDFSLITILNSIAWLLISVYPLSLLSSNITKAVKQAKLTGWIVHKLMATAMEQEFKVELKKFSLQLLHENISLTAYGFFTLDCTMLHSILGATATYLVILIQFPQAANTYNTTQFQN